MVCIKDANDEKGIQKADSHFKQYSFCENHDLSIADVKLYDVVKDMQISEGFPYLRRWMKMMKSIPCAKLCSLRCAEMKPCGKSQGGSCSLPKKDNACVLPKKCGKDAKKEDKKNDDDDDFLDLDDEDTGKLKIDLKAQMKKAAPKQKKVNVAKSSLVLEVMPADAELDISNLYNDYIKKIVIDGLCWGETFRIEDGPFGLKKLNFSCAIEDEKVNTDMIEELIEIIGLNKADAEKFIQLRREGELEDYDDDWEGKLVGSVKVLSFNKL